MEVKAREGVWAQAGIPMFQKEKTLESGNGGGLGIEENLKGPVSVISVEGGKGPQRKNSIKK